jgi:hypothetical protein
MPFSCKMMFLSFNRNTTDISSGAGTDYPFGTPEFNRCILWAPVAQSLVFCGVLCRSLFVCFHLASGHHTGVFDLFLFEKSEDHDIDEKIVVKIRTTCERCVYYLACCMNIMTGVGTATTCGLV